MISLTLTMSIVLIGFTMSVILSFFASLIYGTYRWLREERKI